jgi:asparagine synthase (glutamine-hydrolysing)
MCGIVGLYSRTKSNISERVYNALTFLNHRGPDDSGCLEISCSNGALLLGHKRLSIIDLSSAGHQPMYSRDKSHVIVFNGEIYNYKEIRRDLEELGLRFTSNSDTEVLLAAWVHWGHDVLNRLKGMFAFVVYDIKSEMIYCARDAFGIKPFYYALENEEFSFASEINALKKANGGEFQLNGQRVYDYLNWDSYDDSVNCFYREIQQLMPGHLMSIDLKAKSLVLNQLRWWNPDRRVNSKISLSSAINHVRKIFLESIHLHMRSDVQIGAALSGGIDSAAIVCAIRYLYPHLPIHTFSYIASRRDISEEYWIDLVNKHVGAIGHKIHIEAEEFFSDFEELVSSQGEPFTTPSVYANFRVFKEASRCGIKVLLEGQGADELFGGYISYIPTRICSLIHSRSWARAFKLLKELGAHPSSSWILSLKLLIGELVSGKLYYIFRRLNRKKLRPSWFEELEEGKFFKYFSPKKRSKNNSSGRFLIEELYVSQTLQGLPSLLRHSDRNSMHFSIESRVPFLTTELSNFLLTLPEEFLISDDGVTKFIFREAMRGIVPDEILDRRDKIGFEIPQKEWTKSLKNKMQTLLFNKKKIPFLKLGFTIKKISNFMLGQCEYDLECWRLINYLQWHELNEESS